MLPNVFFLLIDSLRFDQVIDPRRLGLLAPTLASLVERGLLVPIITNSHSTKFTLPSLFTQTYPLDHGGYNKGIDTRPRSFVEVLQAHGYQTIGVFSHDLNGPTGSYERGFDRFHVIYDHRLAVRNYLSEVFAYHIERWRNGKYNEDAIVTIAKGDFGAILAQNADNLHRVPSRGARRVLWRIRPRLARRYLRERELLEREPLTVLNKIATIPPQFYTRYLGRPAAGWTLRARLYATALVHRVQRVLRRFSWYKFQLLPFRVPAVAGELLGVVRNCIGEARRPWFCYVHVMDLHDAGQLNRPVNFLRKLLYVPRCVWARWRADATVPFRTDLALVYFDRQFAKLLRGLKAAGRLDDTMIVITADHGNGWDEGREATLSQVFGFRTHYEHLNVPLIVAYEGERRSELDRARAEGLYDSMSVSATVLDLLGLPQDKSFEGRSIFRGARRAVVSENAGRGNCDVALRDLYFTVTSKTHKWMARLEGNQLHSIRLYDLRRDPRELDNIVDRDGSKSAIDPLFTELLAQRGALLRDRGVGGAAGTMARVAE